MDCITCQFGHRRQASERPRHAAVSFSLCRRCDTLKGEVLQAGHCCAFAPARSVRPPFPVRPRDNVCHESNNTSPSPFPSPPPAILSLTPRRTSLTTSRVSVPVGACSCSERITSLCLVWSRKRQCCHITGQ